MDMNMKRYTSVIILALTLVGCTIDEPAAPLDGGTEVTMRIQREPDAITRAALSGSANIAFQAGDSISVFDADGNNCEFIQSGEIGTDGSATFTGKVRVVADSYLALYPYMAEVKVADGKIGTIGADDARRPVNIPDQQQAVAGSFDPKAFVSVAQSVKVSNSVHNITFHNACALVKFTVPEDLDGLTFEKAVLKSESQMLAGSVTITPDGAAKYVGPGSGSITLNGTMKAGQSYYFCALPHAIKGLSISLFHYPTDETPVVVKSVAADREVKLVRNQVLNLGAIDVAEMPLKEDGWYGEGTAANPYQISTKSDMELLLDRLANGADPHYRGLNYRLTDDIDCEGDSLIADGRKVEFCGVFDGNGHTISNYELSTYSEQSSSNTYDYCGLFHCVYRATFRNLTLRPANDTVVLHNHNYVSPFIAQVDNANGVAPTLIENCRIAGDFDLKFCNWGGSVSFGGFVGNNYSDDLDFVNSCNDANYTFSENDFIEIDEDNHWYEHGIQPNTSMYIGGFIGHMYNKDNNSTTDFDRCRNRGDITFNVSVEEGYVHCGGFIGYGNWGFLYANTYTFTNCVNSGDITMKPGDINYSVYASGFVGFSQIDGCNHSTSSAGTPEQHLAVPHFYNCLNKGDITAQGNGAHAAGFVFYSKSTGNNGVDRHTDNANEFRLCINIGEISAKAPDQAATYAAAISSGYGDCKWCWWLEKDKDHPVLSCTLDGVATNCYCYPTINADTPNNRRLGSDGKGGTDIVLSLSNSQWSEAWWKQKTVEWIGGSRDSSLDLNF